MADCSEPGCAKVNPWELTYASNWKAILSANAKNIDVAWLMAICQKESENKYFWLGNETLYGYNKVALFETTKVRYFEIEKFVLTRTGEGGAPRIPKWRFEPGWWHQINKRPDYAHFSPQEKAAFSCSYGIAQQSAFYYTADLAVENKMPALQIFCRNPDLQHLTLVKEVQRLMKQSHNSTALMYSKYNSGASDTAVTSYGTITVGFEHAISEWLKNKGVKTCLV